MTGDIGEQLEAELDRLAQKMAVEHRQLDDELVRAHLKRSARIMLHPGDRIGRGTHYFRRREPGWRWYIRMGVRSQVKRYLASCEVTFVNGEPTLFQYRLAEQAGGKGGL